MFSKRAVRLNSVKALGAATAPLPSTTHTFRGIPFPQWKNVGVGYLCQYTRDQKQSPLGQWANSPQTRSDVCRSHLCFHCRTIALVIVVAAIKLCQFLLLRGYCPCSWARGIYAESRGPGLGSACYIKIQRERVVTTCSKRRWGAPVPPRRSLRRFGLFNEFNK